MKISNIFLILVLTLGLVACQDFSYFPAGGASDFKTFDANEGQMLRHIYSTTVYYTGNSQYDAKTIDLTATFNGKMFDADQEINVAASLIAYDAQSPGSNGASDKFNYVEVKNIAINGGRTAVTLTIGFVRPNIAGDTQSQINKIGYSIICVGSKFGKSSDPSSLSRVYARTGRIKDNLNSADSIALFTFPGLTSDDTPFGFAPTASQKLLCGTQNGKVYIQGCATYKILTTVSGFSHGYLNSKKNFRVATIPVNSLTVAPNTLITDNGDFGQNALRVLPENIYPYGIYLNYDPGALNTPGRTTYTTNLNAVQASIVVVMIRRTGYTNYPANLLHEEGQFIAILGARGYYSDQNTVNDNLLALFDSHKPQKLKLNSYQKQNMGHLYLGAQQIDNLEKFDIRVNTLVVPPPDYYIKAYNKEHVNNARMGVGALLFSTVDVCEDTYNPILSGTPSIAITPAGKATANTNQYSPVVISTQTRNMYQYTVNNFDAASKVTVSDSHNYVIPAGVDTVIYDVQFDPTGAAPGGAEAKVQYTIKVGTKTVGPFNMAAGIRHLILESVTSGSTINAVITVIADNQNFMTSIKISEGLFYFAKVLADGQCLSTCPVRPSFALGYDFTSSPKSCIYCQTSINQEYTTSNNGQCVCKDNFVAKPNTNPLQCIPCTDSLCRKCQAPAVGPQTCDQCVENAVKNAGVCRCKNFFYQSGSQCLPCGSGCTACTTATTCSSCKASTNGDGVVTRDQTTCLCKDGFYEDPTQVTDVSAICKSCSSPCIACSDSPTTCTKCNEAANFVLKNNKCVCADGYYIVGSNCVKCSNVCATCAVSSVYCTSCPDKRGLAGIANLQYKTCKCQDPYVELDYSCIDSTCSQIDPKCQTCGIDLSGLQAKRCLSCIDNRIVSGGKCMCKPGFYEADNGKCTACPNGCQSCTSAAGSCQCANNAFPNGQGGCTCQPGLFLSTFANGPYCRPCSSNCATCEDNENKCKSCKPTFNLNDNNVCVCTGNTYQSGGQCVTCTQNCLSCTGANQCSGCRDGYKWDPVNFRCSLTCPDRKYDGGSECLDCSTGCAQCVSSYICNNCDATYNLYAGSCRTKCPDTTYAKDGKCYPCPAECNTCTSPDSCDSCNDPYILQAKKCVRECSDGTYLGSSKACISCDSSCKTCKLKSDFCTSCQSPQILYQNKCYDTCPVAIVGGVCTDKCPDGKFLQGKACVDCDSKCKTCQNSQSNCLSCTSGLSYNGDCVDSCPSNSFASGQTCVPCDISCKSCSDNAFKCSQCANGYIKSGDYCVRSCEPGTFFDIRSSSCQNCGAGCKVCTSSSVCTTCYDPRLSPVGGACQRTCPNGASFVGDICVCNFGWLHNSVCVSTCPDGFYATASKTCAQCSFPCLTCSGSANSCSSCVAGYNFDLQTNTCTTKNDCPYGQIKDRSGNCRRICDYNSFYYNSGCVYTCPPGFDSNEYGGCVQTISPSVCTFPLFQQGSSCVYYCQNGFYPDSQARLCKSCGSNCLNCLSDKFCINCATNYSPSYDQSECILTSDCSQNQFKYNNYCQDQCPVGTYASDKLCYRACRTGTFLYNALCYSSCPTDFRTTEACLERCPSGTSCISTRR